MRTRITTNIHTRSTHANDNQKQHFRTCVGYICTRAPAVIVNYPFEHFFHLCGFLICRTRLCDLRKSILGTLKNPLFSQGLARSSYTLTEKVHFTCTRDICKQIRCTFAIKEKTHTLTIFTLGEMLLMCRYTRTQAFL